MEVIATRRIDEIGRLVLPIEVRKQLELQQGDSLDICSDGILLKKPTIDKV